MGFHIIYTFILQQRVPKVVADASSLAIFQRTSHLQGSGQHFKMNKRTKFTDVSNPDHLRYFLCLQSFQTPCIPKVKYYKCIIRFFFTLETFKNSKLVVRLEGESFSSGTSISNSCYSFIHVYISNH